MKGKIKTILIILAIIIGIKGFFEFIKEEPISTKVETVTILDTYHDVGLHTNDYKIKIDTDDGWTYTVNTDKDIYNYCVNHMGSNTKLIVQRTRLVHWIWNSEVLRIVGY
jgi:hypothetical protein